MLTPTVQEQIVTFTITSKPLLVNGMVIVKSNSILTCIVYSVNFRSDCQNVQFYLGFTLSGD